MSQSNALKDSIAEVYTTYLFSNACIHLIFHNCSSVFSFVHTVSTSYFEVNFTKYYNISIAYLENLSSFVFIKTSVTTTFKLNRNIELSLNLVFISDSTPSNSWNENRCTAENLRGYFCFFFVYNSVC